MLQMNVKISDYGIARLASATGLHSSEGTPGYRAPEVVKGQPYSRPADVFSYGVVLYELLHDGTHPYATTDVGHRIDENMLDGLHYSLSLPPGGQRAQQQRRWAAVQDVIAQCFSWSPDDRPKVSYQRWWDNIFWCNRTMIDMYLYVHM